MAICEICGESDETKSWYHVECIDGINKDMFELLTEILEWDEKRTHSMTRIQDIIDKVTGNE